MKKVTLFVAMAALAFTSCNKDESLQFEMSNQTITASMETDVPQTRTAFDRETGNLYWIAGDDIAVLNTNGGFTEYTLTAGAGTANATFTAKAKIGSNSTFALHPYGSHKYENSNLTFNLPASYTYETAEKGNEYGAAPMIAQTDEEDATNFYFEHLGGAFCFTINNLPASTTYFKFEADEQITGEFDVTTNTESGKLEISLPNTQEASNEVYAVTINFPTEESATNKKFFIPLPVGTIDGFKISLGTADGETWSYTSTASNTITRKKLLAMPVVTLDATVDGTVVTEVSTPEALKTAFANGGAYKLTSNIDLALTTGGFLTIAEGKSVSIDLNGMTLTTSSTMGNNSPDDITVCGTLTIKNGSIKTANTAIWANGGTLTMIDCNVSSTNTNGATAVCVDNGELTISGGSYTGVQAEKHDRYVIGVRKSSTATINTTVSGGNGGVTVTGSGTKATLTGGNYSGVKACGLYINQSATVTYENCTFDGVEGDVVVGELGGTVNGTTYNDYTKIQ